MNVRKKHYFMLGVVPLLAIAGLWYLVGIARDSGTNTTRPDVNLLEQRNSAPEFMRLQEGLVPPTNRWFSSLVFGETQTVFAYPFSYKATGTGFQLSVPQLTASPNAVFGSHRPDISVNLDTQKYVVSDYDDLSVTAQYMTAESETAAEITLAQGHPFVFLKAVKPTEITVELANMANFEQRGDETALFTVSGQRYGIRGSGVSGSARDTSLTISLDAKEELAFFAIPDDIQDVEPYIAAARHLITGTEVKYKRENEVFTTRYVIETENGHETIFGGLPHHGTLPGNTVGSFDTLYGKLTMHTGSEFMYKTDAIVPPMNLNLADVPRERLQDLRTYLAEDAESLTLTKTDSYFGGKELYRAANLLLLANQLNEANIQSEIKQMLSGAMAEWLGKPDSRTEKIFYYDRILRGVVGLESAFGSERFNDHHFHYGYFIYAASVLAQYDDAFVDKYGGVVDLLAADIANTQDIDEFPQLRVYDRFTGHSWASGYADFADGNNQESSSEAVNAWYAAYRWAHVTGNGSLENTALWLYSNEVNAAHNYWLKDQRDQEGFRAYEHSIVSIVWNGKRDYATFFSPRPQAMLGIQLIPMSPGHGYLQNTAIGANIQEAAPGESSISGQFGDYLVMYDALGDPERALSNATKLRDSEIDDANSRTYLYAWLYSQFER